MKRFMILAALLASIHAAGAEDAPSRSRIQDITKGARDLVPSMPSISMPALLSMPSVSLPSMPDFSILDFSYDALVDKFNAFTQQVADSLPTGDYRQRPNCGTVQWHWVTKSQLSGSSGRSLATAQHLVSRHKRDVPNSALLSDSAL
jgi:hypothetical protein